jgi:hypothetical protein
MEPDPYPQPARDPSPARDESSRSLCKQQLSEENLCFSSQKRSSKSQTFDFGGAEAEPAVRRRAGAAEPAVPAETYFETKNCAKSVWNSETFAEFESFLAAELGNEAGPSPEAAAGPQAVQPGQSQGDTALAFATFVGGYGSPDAENKTALDTVQHAYATIALCRLWAAANGVCRRRAPEQPEQVPVQAEKEAGMRFRLLQSLCRRN